LRTDRTIVPPGWAIVNRPPGGYTQAMASFPQRRLRRLRRSPALRDMLAEVRLHPADLIAPLFVSAGESHRREIPSMPGQFQFSVDQGVETARRWADMGIPAVLLFGVVDPAARDPAGSAAWADDAPVQQALRAIREALPEMVLLADTCLCEYTSDGHCGPLADGEVVNDAALESLARTAVSQARAGADIVAPSAMMDGQVAAIRTALDQAGHEQTAILSYAVKYASSFYGPFRDAAASSPAKGDRRGYQMDIRTVRQAWQEAAQDIDEGADMLMVKPAATCLDILAGLRTRTDLPLAGYHVSGEYAQIKAAAANGWLDEQAAIVEVTTAIRRAGADLVITYFAEDLCRLLDGSK
jgi:porphobilinogen synthase